MQRSTTCRAIGTGLALLGLLTLGGCGGSGGSASAKVASLNGSGATTTTSKTGSTTDFRTAALAFAKCMREHGVDFPDPKFDDDGGGVQIEMKGDPNSPSFQDAQKACQEFAPGKGGPGGGPGPVTKSDGGDGGPPGGAGFSLQTNGGDAGSDK